MGFIEPRAARFQKIDRFGVRQNRRSNQAAYVLRRAEEDRLYREGLARKPAPAAEAPPEPSYSP